MRFFWQKQDSDESEVEKAIIGLGNPGGEYSGTRHNLGWVAVDRFLKKTVSQKSKYERHKLYKYREFEFNGMNVIAVKPVTYMNLSGKAIVSMQSTYHIGTENILVVHDEMDLTAGTAKMKTGGGSAGHNGIQSIIDSLKTKEFTRIKIGINRPVEDGPNTDPDWVLGKISPEEMEVLEPVLANVVAGIEKWLTDGSEKAMTWFNTRMNENSREEDPVSNENDIDNETRDLK